MQPSQGFLHTLEEIVYGKRKGPLASTARGFLYFLSILYNSILWLYMLPFKLGIRKMHQLPAPVISIGNITVGGTGKTPMVKYVCRGLTSRGWNPAVLSYGYGGRLHGDMAIVSDGREVLLGAETAGDEPVMLARDLTGVPVVVGKHRHLSGQTAITDCRANVLVLDDGFQVWKLHRDFDIVLIDCSNPFDNGNTLPAGRLREPSYSLKRADCVILTGGYSPEKLEYAESVIREIEPHIPVYVASISPRELTFPADGSKMDVSWLSGRQVLALSSIGNPASFERTLKELGAVLETSKQYPDHHSYTARDVHDICRRAESAGVECIVTTEKDSVKLQGHSFGLPLVVLSIDYSLDNEDDFWGFMESRLAD